MIEYGTITVCLQSLGEDRYESIVRGPSGDGRAHFELSFGTEDRRALAEAVTHSRLRRMETRESEYARVFGERIFGLVFQGTALDVLRASSRQTQENGCGLRFMFELEGAPKLRNVPWELLYDPPRFVSTSAETPILRHVELPSRRPPLKLRPPLRILGMVSNPSGTPPLDVRREQAQLLRACKPSIDEGLLKIQWAPDASPSTLLECLNSETWHVFHFIGHGDFDEQQEDGVLIFEGPAGRPERVPSHKLATILRDYRDLRLVVVNACEGARTALDSSGVAVSLMKHGLPAVIAMQFEITDEAAIGFAHGFYSSLVRNHPIDKALADARRGMLVAGHDLEWATPVLFMGDADGRLFDVQRAKRGRQRGGPATQTQTGRPHSHRPREGQASPPGGRPYLQAQQQDTGAPPTAWEPSAAQAGWGPPAGQTAWASVAPQAAPQPHPAAWRPTNQQGVAASPAVAAPYVDLGTRLRAGICDGFVAFMLYAVPADGLKPVGAFLGVLLAFAYYVVPEGRGGQTLGKRWKGIRVLDADSGGAIGYGRAFARIVALYLTIATAGIGLLWMVFDNKRQGLHDKLARSIVVWG